MIDKYFCGANHRVVHIFTFFGKYQNQSIFSAQNQIILNVYDSHEIDSFCNGV